MSFCLIGLWRDDYTSYVSTSMLGRAEIVIYNTHTHTHHAQWTQPMQLAVLVRLSHAILHAEFSWAASVNMETRKMFLAHFIIKITNNIETPIHTLCKIR